MSKDNGNEERKKKCPFLNDWCIGDSCVIHTYLHRVTPAGVQKQSACGFEAMIVMLSEINQKTPMPQRSKQPEIILPFMGRG